MMHAMLIRNAKPGDRTAIASIIMPTIRDGMTYTLDADMSEADALRYWLEDGKETFVAEYNDTILGTYYMRQN